MTARHFAFPKLTEIRVSRSAPRAQSIAAPTQRDLVAASLLLCPYGKEAGVRRDRRSF
jgi:hypothetical protein